MKGRAKMPEVDKTAILKRANELCEQDGFVWELTYKPEPNLPRRPLNERQRQEYLARAEAEVSREGGTPKLDHFSITVSRLSEGLHDDPSTG
jgi:hypothetical protein